jgi:hypothetical protein
LLWTAFLTRSAHDIYTTFWDLPPALIVLIMTADLQARHNRRVRRAA